MNETTQEVLERIHDALVVQAALYRPLGVEEYSKIHIGIDMALDTIEKEIRKLKTELDVCKAIRAGLKGER